MSNFTVGLDLGQAQDYTALAIIERVPQMELQEVVYSNGAVDTRRVERDVHLHCRHLERYPLNMRYPTIVEKAKSLLETPALRGCKFVLDATGCGRPVFDMFGGVGLRPIGVLVTGGDKAHYDAGFWKIPKRDLVASVQVALQAGTLKFAEGMPLVPTLIQEMLAFKVKISESAHDSYGAWRENEHDDLLFALMLAAWAAHRPVRQRARSSEY